MALVPHVESANDGQPIQKARATHTREWSTSGTFALLQTGEPSSTTSGVSVLPRGEGHPDTVIGTADGRLDEETVVAAYPRLDARSGRGRTSLFHARLPRSAASTRHTRQQHGIVYKALDKVEASVPERALNMA